MNAAILWSKCRKGFEVRVDRRSGGTVGQEGKSMEEWLIGQGDMEHICVKQFL